MSNLQYQNVLTRDCKNPPYDGQNLTNRVLVRNEPTTSGKKSIIYYCPVYLRLKLKNFSDMNLADLSATINQVIIMTINMKNIPPIIQDEIKKRIVLRFNRDDPISLGTKTEEISEKFDQDGVITFTIRKLLHAGMKAQIFLSPFQMINLILTVKLQKVHINKQDLIVIQRQMIQKLKSLAQENSQQSTTQQQITSLTEQISFISNLKHIGAYFNLMDCTKNTFIKISYSEEGTFGNYDLAEQRLDVQYSNYELSSYIRTKEDNKEAGMKNFDFSEVSEYQFCHFVIPLYKFPFVTLSTIFIPLWLLGIINLGIFFQDTTLGDRIGSLAALMIAFVALIPVIRQALPPNPNITLVQFLVYFETMTTLLCFIESVIVRGMTNYTFEPFANGLFLSSLIINIGQVVIITILMLIHKCYWQRSYNRHVEDIGDIKFDFKEWKNPQCDEHFRRKIDDRSICVLRALKDVMFDQQKKKEEERKKGGSKKEEKGNAKPNEDKGKKQEKKEEKKQPKK